MVVLFLFLFIILWSVGVCEARGLVRKLTRDWQPVGMWQLRVAKVSASSFLGPQYAPDRVADKNRGTKWVATETPSKESPQWITLNLVGTQEVSDVALFGERIDNDGVIDAQVRVAHSNGRFATVAEIKNASFGSWLATFKPVEANAVQVLITQSGGPSTHTDVYEIMVFGPKPSTEKMQARADELLSSIRNRLKAVQRTAADWPRELEVQQKEINTLITRLLKEELEIREKLSHWNNLTDAQRRAVLDRAENLFIGLPEMSKGLRRAEIVWERRRKESEPFRETIAEKAKSKKPFAIRDGSRICVIGSQVAIELDEADGAWRAVWLDGIDATLRRVRFSIGINGKTYQPTGVKADVREVSETLGRGMAIMQQWAGDGVEIERRLTVYNDIPVVVIGAAVTNRTDGEISLGIAQPVSVSSDNGGWWSAGRIVQTPGVVTVAGLSGLICEPVCDWGKSSEVERSYGGTQVMAIAHQDPLRALIVGFLTAREAKPYIRARFRFGEAGVDLEAGQNFLGRKLRPGERLEFDPVYVAARRDPYKALERYGDAVAASSPLPVRKGATALWCSWYAHRMAMTEDLILANAAVIAKHFKPLGMEIVQLDHGWQRGDITGDWTANEKFPHGLKWLADQLSSRYGLRMGLWIAPTDVAETSLTFKEHQGWMLCDDAGKPKVNWRWYWRPNPNCYVLDASRPEAAEFIEKTFGRLSADGASYYKIDFISASGSEGFHQYNPHVTRGWGVLRRAMEAIRKGAGLKAWIRYCQTPPLLAVGLADSAYGGSDTLDAGVPSVFSTLRPNARSLAASYWINDRLYHREICDMSVGMRGALWEVQMKMAMMVLGGCSVSFSDELQYLTPSRIRMMQQCLPPGAPPMQPIDLFRRSIPSVWRVHCKRDFGEWDVIGLFNFSDEQVERVIEFSALGLHEDEEVVVFDFWEEKFLGVHRKRFACELLPRGTRILFLHRVSGTPQVIGTDMHLLGGYHEIKRLAWNKKTLTLSGVCQRMPGMSGKLYILVPSKYSPRFTFPLNANSASITHVNGSLWMKEILFENETVEWSVTFERTEG